MRWWEGWWWWRRRRPGRLRTMTTTTIWSSSQQQEQQNEQGRMGYGPHLPPPQQNNNPKPSPFIHETELRDTRTKRFVFARYTFVFRIVVVAGGLVWWSCGLMVFVVWCEEQFQCANVANCTHPTFRGQTKKQQIFVACARVSVVNRAHNVVVQMLQFMDLWSFRSKFCPFCLSRVLIISRVHYWIPLVLSSSFFL